jgi:hypothetical protein
MAMVLLKQRAVLLKAGVVPKTVQVVALVQGSLQPRGVTTTVVVAITAAAMQQEQEVEGLLCRPALGLQGMLDMR